MPDADLTLDYLLDNIWVVGAPETVAAKLARLGDDVGGFGVGERRDPCPSGFFTVVPHRPPERP